jgi:hypothetical protein
MTLIQLQADVLKGHLHFFTHMSQVLAMGFSISPAVAA